MIEGDVIYQGVNFVVIQTGGLGYKVFLPEQIVFSTKGRVTFFTHEVIRDSERELYGLTSMHALELFWRLISVSGVGSKSAQKIVYAEEIGSVKQKIQNGDLTFLTSVQGIGKKTAQKIVLELKGVFVEDEIGGGFDEDAISALQALGYSRRDSEQILSTVQAETTEERVVQALKMLGK